MVAALLPIAIVMLTHPTPTRSVGHLSERDRVESD